MRYFATYLIYAAVVTRAAGWSQDGPPIPLPAWILLAIYGLLLFSERALTRALAWYPRLYILLQSVLVIAMLYTAPTVDIFPMLFFPLSFQAVQFFPPRAGFAWIGVFSLAMAGLFLVGMEWEAGIVMLLFSSGANALMGSFALLIERTERARRENQRLFGELQEAYRGLKDYTAQAEALAAAEERQRLVRELHDSLTQTLFSMNLAVQAAQLAAEQDSSQVVEHLRRLQILSRSAASEVQSLTGQAPAHTLIEEGLAAALKRLVAERQAQDGLQITLEVAGARELPQIVATNLYHIAQEALNNAAKHAGPCQVAVHLDFTSQPACLEITDTGCGFDLPGRAQRGGFGLEGMAARAREIGWELKIESLPGQGTRVHVWEKMG
jgi:signal transduction histidine kinase